MRLSCPLQLKTNNVGPFPVSFTDGIYSQAINCFLLPPQSIMEIVSSVWPMTGSWVSSWYSSRQWTTTQSNIMCMYHFEACGLEAYWANHSYFSLCPWEIDLPIAHDWNRASCIQQIIPFSYFGRHFFRGHMRIPRRWLSNNAITFVPLEMQMIPETALQFSSR